MRQLSKEAETRLLTAIEQAAANVNAGEKPNEAIVKIAKAQDMPAGQVRLMVHAYNTGRTTACREAGNSPAEKAADFQLADVDAILDELFPAVAKTAAEIARNEVVSTEYAVPPTGFLGRRKQMQKTAFAPIETTWTPPPRDEHAAAMRAASQKQAAVRADEELRRQATAAHTKAAAAMDALHEYFRRPGNMSFQDAVRETQLRYGDAAVSALKKVAAVYPHLEKQAATNARHFGVCVPCDMAQNVTTAVETWVDAQSKLPQPKVAEVKLAPEIVTGSILSRASEVPLELKKADASSSPFSLNPASMTRNLGEKLYEGGGSYIKEPDAMMGATLKEITDPDHERKLRNIRAQSVVTDLMTNDPVISGHDPREVANAFNELAEIAPNFMDSTATVQALLRKRLEAGQLADFDVKQLLELEKIRAEKQKNLADTKMIETRLVSPTSGS